MCAEALCGGAGWCTRLYIRRSSFTWCRCWLFGTKTDMMMMMMTTDVLKARVAVLVVVRVFC